MTTFEIVIHCITALGALATAGAFIYVVKGQKDNQKQIDSLSQMAATFARHYEMAKIQAGSSIYPNVKISSREGTQWGSEIVVKNNSYPIHIYRVIANANHHHTDIRVTPLEGYATITKGESKTIFPAEVSGHSMYAFDMASIRIFLITPFDEAYEIRYSSYEDGEPYQSEPIPIVYEPEEHKSGGGLNYRVKEYTIHGNIPGTLEENFPEISEPI